MAGTSGSVAAMDATTNYYCEWYSIECSEVDVRSAVLRTGEVVLLVPNLNYRLCHPDPLTFNPFTISSGIILISDLGLTICLKLNTEFTIWYLG